MTRNRLRIPVAVVSATLLLGALAPMRASGDTIDDKKAQAQQLQAEIDENGARISALTERYNGAVLEYNNAQARVAETKQRLAAAEAEQGRLNDLVAARGAALYMGAQDPTSLFPDTNIESFNELGSRTKYGEVATGNDEQLIANLERAKQDLDVLREQYNDEVEAASKQRDEIASARDDVESANQRNEQLLSQVNGEIATLIAEQKEREAAELRASLEAIANSGSDDDGGGGSRVPASSVGGGSIPNLPAPSPGAAAAIAYAEAQLGKPYRYAAAGPDAFDCSGLTMMAWAAGGVSMGHYSGAQMAAFPSVPLDEMQPGDLIFWGPGGSEHVAMYVGGGLQIAATHTGDYVRIQPVGSNPVGAVRPG